MRFESWRPWSTLALGLLTAFTFGAGCQQAGDQQDDVSLAEGAVTTTISGSLKITNDWGNGYCAGVTITNNGSAAITAWTAVVQLNQSAMSSIWNATATQSGSRLTAVGVAFNSALAAGASGAFGFCADGTGSNYRATSVTATGTSGGGSTGLGGKTGAGGAGQGGSGQGGKTGAGGAGQGGSGQGGAIAGCSIPSFVAATPSPIGWASLNGGTTGGGKATPMVVTTLAQLVDAAKGTDAAVIYVKGKLAQGTVTIGSNKTIVGCSGTNPAIQGHVAMSGSTNVIIRNLSIIGYNCAPPDVDVNNGGECQDGEDAVTVQKNAKNLWFDHDAVSDGSDGNLDITHASDFITISYTKFFYSTKRSDPNDTGAVGHRVCNLIGHSDSNSSEDTGHLNVTFHHNWWADNVMERMPRVRFGKVHVFNNLYTAAGNNYAVGLGVNGNVRVENNVFQGVNVPLDITDYSNSASILQSSGNLFQSTTGNAVGVGTAFSPSYSFALDSTASLASALMANVGPK
jgi:pectate lyase